MHAYCHRNVNANNISRTPYMEVVLVVVITLNLLMRCNPYCNDLEKRYVTT